MVGHIRGHHMALEVVPEVEHVVFDAELVGHPAGVVDVGHGAAAGVAGSAPQLHGDPRDVVAGLKQPRRGYR